MKCPIVLTQKAVGDSETGVQLPLWGYKGKEK
jgi:hypothetical protein